MLKKERRKVCEHDREQEQQLQQQKGDNVERFGGGCSSRAATAACLFVRQ
jgi:hypothetical protein